MSEPPRPDVLAERINGLIDRVGGIERRMSELATEKTLIALIEGRDLTVNAILKAMQDDVAKLTAALATERSERIAGDQAERKDREEADNKNEERARNGKTIAIGAISLGVSIVVALVAMISTIGGVPV